MNGLIDWAHFGFANPYFLLLLLLVPVMIWRQQGKKADAPAMRLTTLGNLAKDGASGRARYRPLLFVLYIIGYMALVIAIARPQTSNTTEHIDSEGIDIVLAIDVSGSMLAMDLKPDRIEASKAAALKFVEARPGDRIGLVIFSGESFTMCPVTIDHNILKEQINQVHSGMLVDGTSIGMGLATAVERLRTSKAKSRVVILLTDGVNNTGLIDPNTALEIAKAYKIRVYTIGAGTKGEAMMPVPTPTGTQTLMVKVEIDEELLKQIAHETGGRYYRATDSKTLNNVYQEINKLEKSKVEVNSFKHYKELFLPFALAAAICLGLSMLLRYTVLKSIT